VAVVIANPTPIRQDDDEEEEEDDDDDDVGVVGLRDTLCK